MEKATLTRREHVITALLYAPAGLATSALLIWGTKDINGPHGPAGIAFDIVVGLAVWIWIYRNADWLNQPRRPRQRETESSKRHDGSSLRQPADS